MEPPYLRYGWLMMGVHHEARHPYHEMVDAAYMTWAHSRQYRINVWTVDDPQRIEALAKLGVDAIITNRPDVALKTLGRTVEAR
jgi:glycerophosphoryl diester phosphodiesterase